MVRCGRQGRGGCGKEDKIRKKVANEMVETDKEEREAAGNKRSVWKGLADMEEIIPC